MMSKYFLLIIYLLLHLHALELKEQKTYRNPPFRYYEDIHHQFDIEKIQLVSLKKWGNLKERRYNFGHSTAAFWLRIDLVNRSVYENWILCSKKLLNFLDVYLVEENRVVYQSHVGTKVAFEKRDIAHSYFLFPLSLQQPYNYTLYIRVASEPILGIDIRLYEKYEFWQLASQDYSNQMFIFGCLFILVLYNAAIGYFTRNIKYLFYILYLGSLTLFLMQQEGFLATFLPMHIFDNELHAFFATSGIAFFTVFIYYFFHIKKYFPYIKKIFFIALSLLTAVFVLYLLKVIVFHYCIKAILVVVGILIVTIPRMTWEMHKTNRSVIYFATGWLSLCIGTIVHMLYTEAYIDQEAWYENFYRYLFVFEGVLFSLALSNRINEQKEQKLRLQIELYTYQEQEKLRLQQMVNEQTAKLEEAMVKTQKASEAKSEFLANMSHELRSPLNAIIGFGQIIQRDCQDPSILNYIKIIQSSSEHLLDVINQVLELSRIVDKETRFSFDIVADVSQNTTRRNSVTFTDIGKLKVAQKTAQKILIVDDREYNRTMLENILRPLGFDTYHAVDGQQAIATWKLSLASLVLMDMRMPVMDGYEATRHLKKLNSNTTIIAVTASAFAEDEQAIWSAGCDDIIIKPVDATQLLKTIDKYIKLEHVDKVEASHNNFTVDDVLCKKDRDLLKQAAIEADVDELDKIINNIPTQYTTLRTMLNDYVSKFDYDRIVDMLDGEKDNDP